ncbi:YceI family protein [Sediminibacterium sp.]|uniref:YceI family protein n=1 Tax=Sediminibacterium sp. TaxID=1917865 RepID=UPI002735B2DC|nr:YceI family protein [Sediminibacterium sp.]MDP3394457.1 YceI family protein [Sediminibacterium sp.]MDP3568292.1 YceI family protein [Sediminibacterium sp.]
MKRLLFVLVMVAVAQLHAQERLLCRNASVKFFSKMPLENIEAVNNQGLSVIDLASGKIEFSVLLKGFIFPNALMQEHFNENYVESSKYPRAQFKGVIQSIPVIDLTKNADYNLTVNGTMQLHGQSKEISTMAQLHVKEGKVTGESIFDLVLEDYAIQIPKLVKDKIAQKISINVKAIYQIQKPNL